VDDIIRLKPLFSSHATVHVWLYPCRTVNSRSEFQHWNIPFPSLDPQNFWNRNGRGFVAGWPQATSSGGLSVVSARIQLSWKRKGQEFPLVCVQLGVCQVRDFLGGSALCDDVWLSVHSHGLLITSLAAVIDDTRQKLLSRDKQREWWLSLIHLTHHGLLLNNRVALSCPVHMLRLLFSQP
jgi:hypothetical protein